MRANSFSGDVDLALNNKDNTLIGFIGEKFSQAQPAQQQWTEEWRKSSTDSDTATALSSDTIKMKSESFSSSTDTITPVLLINQDIIRSLDYTKSKTEKLYVLNAILHSQQESLYYADLFRILREYLNECDTDIFQLALEIHEKCIHSSYELSKDAFVNLLETCYLYYCSLEYDVYVDRYPYRNAFKILKLILNTFDRIFLHVPRYGFRRLEKIVGNFADLLYISVPSYVDDSSSAKMLTPINMIACLDPCSNWCRILVHGSYTREMLFKCIRRNVNLVKCVFVVISDWMNDPYVPIISNRTDIINESTVKYITFVNAVFMCEMLTKYKYFYEFFPVTANNNKVITLNTFTTTFTGFLRNKCSKILPERVTVAMIECVVHLLQFHPAETMVQNVVNILEMVNGKNGKKNSLQIIKLLFDNELITRSLINSIVYTKRSRAGLTNDGKLLRPRPNSSAAVASSRNNIFNVLMNVINNILRNNLNSSNFVRVFNIAKQMLRCHEYYLMFPNYYSTLIEFVELLSLKYNRNCISDKMAIENDELIQSIDELLFAIGSTPIGYLFLCNTKNALLEISMSKLESVNFPWYHFPWKNTIPFMISSEYNLDFNVYCDKTHTELLKLIEEFNECSYLSDQHDLDDIVEKIFICIDSLIYNVNAINSLITKGCECKENLESNEICCFNDFIKKYALNANYEYELQHLALQCLQRITKFMSSRVLLLHLFNYEQYLSSNQTNYTNSNGEIITDQCSILRTELLNGHFSPCDDLQNKDKISANRKDMRKSSSAKMTQNRKKVSEIQKFLQETKHGLYDNNWLRQARKAFKASLSCNLKMSLMIELIEKSAKSIAKLSKVRKLVVTESTTNSKLRGEDYKGIELAIRFGTKNHVLQQNSANGENLAQVFKVIRNYCGREDSEQWVGFDCTLATLFIMCCGSIDKCLQIASYIIPLPVTVFIWPRVTPNFIQKRYTFGHLLEWLLYQEVPNVFSALSIYGISWWLICKCHLEDCFWNSMDWANICQWLCITILYPPDNLMYYFTSVAYKNESKILQTTNECDLRDVLNVIFNTYQFEDHLLYIDYLAKKYHFFISSHFFD
ncbi:uncharacterized protein LOC135840337 [Planococcus citri]|uniref:uncharacterized protein LOC135840337 n=1 Tax=Planococcus citri TaxID=170843 RepID=UPI0031F72895